MRTCATALTMIASSNALMIGTLWAVLLIVAGIALAALACLGIRWIVRLAGARPASLLPRGDRTP